MTNKNVEDIIKDLHEEIAVLKVKGDILDSLIEKLASSPNDNRDLDIIKTFYFQAKELTNAKQEV